MKEFTWRFLKIYVKTKMAESQLNILIKQNISIMHLEAKSNNVA